MRFRWFFRKSDFDTELDNERIDVGDICFILDRLRIYTRSSSFDFSNRPIYQGETSISDSAGTWTVTINGITELYDGLTVKVKITTAQGSSYSTLNVNNLGANPIWFGYGVPLTSSTPLTSNQEVTLTYRTTASASGITVGGTSYTRGWVMSEALKTTISNGLKITSGALELDYGSVSTGNTTKPVTGKTVYNEIPHTYIKTASVSGTTLTLTTQNDSTVDFTNTTYESKSAASGGTDVSLVTTGEKYTWNNKGTYSKPSGGIPKTDLASSVQTSLGLADTAIQDISGKADKSATVSTVSYDSTNKKLTKTINGTTSNVVTVSTLKTDMSLAKSDVGLGNVTNDAQVKRSEMGVASGVATLDSSGKVPSSQLPSYVDDVIEGYYYNGSFYKESTHTTKITGETGKIYVDLSTEKTYRWSGSSFVEISSSDVTGIKVGSSGSTITPSEGVITIPDYETGAQVNTITGVKGDSESSYRTGNVNITKSNIGLGNVGNFKAVSTVASQGLSSTEKSNARANIGAGTSSFSGSYEDLTNKPTIPAAANDGTFSFKTKVGTSASVTAADFTANQSGTDDITFIQGSNVTLTTDTTNRTVTIAATDTTYKSKAAASGGTAVSLVTTGDKYNWNDANSKKHVHSTLTLSTTAQAYDGTHTIALPSSDPYTSARTPASHTHGNIQNGGTLQTTDITIANGDKLVVTDSSNSNKIARTSLSFDGSTTTTALTPKGTFESFSKFSGSYNDLSNKPTIPAAANDGTFSVKTKVGSSDAVTAADFTANQSGTDDITFIQGSNVTLTTDTTNRTVTIAAKDTTYTFDGTYNASTNKAATVSTVTNAINALDGGTIGTGGAGKTITSLSQTNGNVSATFGNISITKSQISDFPTIPTVNNAKFSVKGAGTEVASTTANASSASSVDIVAGANVTVTPDATNKKITIAATDTTYKSKSATSGGTDVSLVTTGEKYTWNNKQSKVSALGSTTKPVYTSAAGTFAECSTYAGGTAVTLNGTSKTAGTASLYAPTSAGTAGQVLLSSAGEPNWKTGEIVHYITSPSGTAGSTTSGAYNRTQWTGTADGVTALYSGLVVFYKIPVAGVSRGVTLNINSLGEHPVVRNVNTNISNSYAVSTVLSLVYDADQNATVYVNNTSTSITGCWKIADYDTNTTYTNQSLGNGYGTCSTGASTAAKTVTLTDYALVKNGFVSVKFTNDVPANATLNINGKGAKNIYYKGAKITADIIKAGDIATFVYDNTQYQLVSIDTQVISPSSSTDAHVAVFDGTTGKKIKDSGFTIGTSVPSDAVFTDTTYTFDGTYNASTNKAATVSTVTNAISGKADKATTLAGYGITDAHISSGVITLGANTIDPVTVSTNQTVSGQKTFTQNIIGNVTGNATTATTAQNLVSKGTSDYFYMADGSLSNGYDLVQAMVDQWSADHGGTLASYQCSSTVYDDIFTS